ncbi:MAG: hypothetical protein Q4G44_05305 [Alcaligenaceae bacterium]|nr:hypothetical protein [Alcaligenaceae bacterium]
MTVKYKKLLTCLAVFALSLSTLLPKTSVAGDMRTFFVYDLARQLSLDLEQKIFQGEVFSLTMSAWQIKADYGFEQLLDALSKQSILQQYHSMGNLIFLSGEYGQHSVLLQLERLGAEAYRGILSVMPVAPTTFGDFSAAESGALKQYLHQETKLLAGRALSWVPESAVLLMSIKSTPTRAQYIYLDSASAEDLNTLLKANLMALGWRQSSTDGLGLKLWSKQSQEIQLYFSQQVEGTALYVLSNDLSKDYYEDTH